MATEGIDVRSVGNTRVLHETALVEAFNLKAAIEYDLRNRTSKEKNQEGRKDRRTKPTGSMERRCWLIFFLHFPLYLRQRTRLSRR